MAGFAQSSAKRAENCDAAVVLLDDAHGIENGDFPAPDVGQMLAGEGQVGGQHPFGAAVDFCLQDLKTFHGACIATQDLQQGEAFGVGTRQLAVVLDDGGAFLEGFAIVSAEAVRHLDNNGVLGDGVIGRRVIGCRVIGRGAVGLTVKQRKTVI